MRTPVTARPAPLLLDLYELTMAQSYLDHGMNRRATFSLFARRLPRGWGYFIAAGLESVLDYLDTLSFGEDHLAYLERTGQFRRSFLDTLSTLRFTGSVRALPEGTAFFPDEPVLEVTAPLIEAQLVETMVLNLAHFQTLIASKAARCVVAAQGRRLVDFALRRTHGADAGMQVARSAFLAGFDATSNVEAGLLYGIPVSGTVAHSYVQAFGDELASFRALAQSYPDDCVLLIDTYDTRRGAELAGQVGRELALAGHQLRGVRIDSGDLVAESCAVRAILERWGLEETTILVSGGLDEHEIAAVVGRGAPVDGFGVGTKLGVCADSPALDMAYKLVAYDGRPVLKLSSGKATWPGAKQVWRVGTQDEPTDDAREGTRERLALDWLTLADDPPVPEATALLKPVMDEGKRLERESLTRLRERGRAEIARLPDALRGLNVAAAPPVLVGARLADLRAQLATESRGDDDARAG